MELEDETLATDLYTKHQTIDEQVENCTEQETTNESPSNNRVEEELYRLLVPDVRDLPLTPPSLVDSNFVSYFAPDYIKPGFDQYVYRHANGLCVIGLAKTHVCFKDEGRITTVDFNVGKSDRSGHKVIGKRKKNAKFLEPNSALCKVSTKEDTYVVRCCVRGLLLEVNERLIKQPQLLNLYAGREGYIAIIMPRPADWIKIKDSLLSSEDFNKLRQAI